MKRFLSAVMMITAMCSSGNTQCLVYAEEELAKYCEGTYLIHQELNNNVRDASLMLSKGNVYILYLLDPVYKNSHFSLINDFQKYNECLHVVNNSDNYQKYIIRVNESREYNIAVDFQSKDKACVLMAVYLQDKLPDKRPGVYNSFEDLRQNSPASGFIASFSERKEKDIYYYTISGNEDKKKYGKVYGFCDGVDIYLNSQKIDPVTGRDRFVKVEKIGGFYYYKTTKVIMSGSTVALLTVEQLVDIGTGKLTTLTDKTLKEIISKDPELLKAYQDEKSRHKKFKEYLIKFADRKSTGRS